MARKDAIEARNAIVAENIGTRFRVRDGILEIAAPGGLTPVQREIAAFYKADLIDYLTTPPPQGGECIRGHPVQWMLDSDGTWICACYYQDQDQDQDQAAQLDQAARGTIATYWTQGRTL